MKIIVKMGLLLPEMNYMASAIVFNTIFKEKGLTPLSQEAWNSIMPKILHSDNQFRRGEIDESTFKQAQSAIYAEHFEQEVSISDEEFDHAWNAMLGDVTLLKTNVEKIQKALQERGDELILMSITNPIHFRCIETCPGLSFDRRPYLSYEKKMMEPELIKQIMQDLQTSESREDILLIKGTLDQVTFEDIKNREEAELAKVQQSIQGCQIRLEIVDPKNSDWTVVDQILNMLKTEATGLKLVPQPT